MLKTKAGMSHMGEKQSFGNALAKVRFGMKSGSLRNADLPGW